MFLLLSKIADRWAKWVAVGGVVVAIAATVYGLQVFKSLDGQTDITAPGSESDQVMTIVRDHFSGQGVAVVVLLSAKDGQIVTDLPFAEEAKRVLADLPVAADRVQSYYSSGNAAFLSRDKTKTYAVAEFEGSNSQVVDQATAFAKEVKSDVLTVQMGGQVMAEKQMMARVESDLIRAELISLPIVGLLLLFFFRSIVAAALPIVLGLFTIIGGLSVIRWLAGLMTIDQYAVNVVTILGLGLAIDYSLLMVNRFREERARGLEVAEAVHKMVMTSGRTIFFSGLTVMSCLAALTLFPLDFLRSVGVGGASALLIAVAGGLIILPSLLYLIGDRLDAWSLPGRRATTASQTGHSLWYRVGQVALKRPVLTLVVSLAVIVAVAWPLKDLQFVGFDAKSLARGTSAQVVAQTLADDFDGQRSSLQVVYSVANPASVEGLRSLYLLQAQLGALRGVASIDGPLPPITSVTESAYIAMVEAGALPDQLKGLFDRYSHDDQVLLTVHLKDDLSGTQERQVVTTIRQLTLNQGWIRVGGNPAILVDLLDVLLKAAPWALGVMAAAIMVLLVLLLQSVVIPAKTIVINAIAMLAAFGLLVAVFQDGWLSGLGWFGVTGGLQPTIPILIFSVAFGLSMDYAAFLYGRMHEEYVLTKDNDQAVLLALDKTGGIITAAALLLLAVVGAFATSSIPLLQQVGVGLAVAVAIDAFVVRMFLVPAIMKLLGNFNWWAPAWLRKWQIRHE